MVKVPLFPQWVESECDLIKADGCSKVSGAFVKCCRVHDLAYRFARDPVSAYRLYLAGDPEYWFNATPITKADADADFRRCMQANSRLGFFSPMALWRWAGVKFFAGKAWESHRAREVAEAVSLP